MTASSAQSTPAGDDARIAAILHDPARLGEIVRLGLADPLPTGSAADALRALVRHVAQECDAPAAVVGVLLDDAQHVLAAHGLDGAPHLAHGWPVEWSFCRLTLAEPSGVLAIPDTTRDARLADNPIVREEGIRAYLGAALRTSGGHVLGALCVLDVVPRHFPAEHATLLRALAREVVARVEGAAAGAA